jgi:geranylgeranyl diphosphate synthase type II
MHYACTDGGKRLRPVLLLEFCRLCGGDVQAALPFACAIEMIHAYSLVHDDMPCMDNSPLRRGKPAVHKKYGEDMALLVGDGLLTFAFETMLSRIENIPADRVLSAALELAQSAGIDGMVGGQTIDLQSEGKTISVEQLNVLQSLKTGALLKAACVMGAILGGASSEIRAAAEKFGKEIGRAFQIVDDILDATADATTLGKPVGADAAAEKSTYVTLLGLQKAKEMAQKHTNEAIEALRLFGDDADSLRCLARALLERCY